MKKILLLLTAFSFFLILFGCDTESWNEERVTVPSIDDVKEAYHESVEAFMWFEMTTMPAESSTKEINGVIYNKVNHNTIKTYADLENYLHSLFSKDIVEEMLNQEPIWYRDIDGELYAILADRGSDIYKGEETLEVQQESDEKFICTVKVELLGKDGVTVTGYETHEFSYELIEGQWVFTNFYLFR